MTHSYENPMQIIQVPTPTLPQVAWLPDGHHYANIGAAPLDATHGLIVPIGISQTNTPLTLPAAGAFAQVTTLTSLLPAASLVPVNANGEFVVPLPGHYTVSISFQFSVTPTGAWIAQVAVYQNGVSTAIMDFGSFVTSVTGVSLQYSTSVLLEAGGRLGVSVSASPISAGTLNFCESQITYLGQYPGQT